MSDVAIMGSSYKTAVPVLLLALLVPSKAFTGCSGRARHYCGRRESFTRCPSAGANRADVRDAGKVRAGSDDPSRPDEVGLEEMELWLDEAGVDRRGGGKGTPSAKLRRFPGRGIGLEAAVDLERDSTVRHRMARLWYIPRSRIFFGFPQWHVRCPFVLFFFIFALVPSMFFFLLPMVITLR